MNQTRYILQGGEWTLANDRAIYWQKQMIKDFDLPVKVLICSFGKPRDKWTEKFERTQRLFKQNLSDAMVCRLATTDNFIKEAGAADLVFLDSGENVATEKAFSKYNGLSKVFRGKTIVGCSAGANILSCAYSTRSLATIRDGLGVLPIKVMTHYNSQPNPNKPIDWQQIGRKLYQHGNMSLPIYAIKEHEFIIVNESGELILDSDSSVWAKQ